MRVGTSSGDVVVGDDEELVERRAQVLAHQIDLFGEGDDEPGLFGIGPRPDLLGRPLDGSPGRSAAARRSRATARATTTRWRPSPWCVWAIVGAAGQEIAVAVNGRVVAVTRSFEHDGDTLVSAVTPEDAYRAGANSVRSSSQGDDTVPRSSRRPRL